MRTRLPHLFGFAFLAAAVPAMAQEVDAGASDQPARAGAPSESPDSGTDAEIDAQTTASFIGIDGTEVGAANLTDVPTGGVLIGLQVERLPGGEWLGFHIHEGSECDPETGFQSAGGHYNPENREHGYYVPEGFHAGDLPNQLVPETSVLRSQVFNPYVSLDGSAPSIRGRTLIVHAQQDDYESQPSGNAGDRLACAEIGE